MINRQFFKYLLFFTHIILFYILFKLVFNTEEWLKIVMIAVSAIHIGYTLILLMSSDRSSNRVYLFYPKLEKRIVHESGEYYIKYDIPGKKYIIYKDNIFRSKSIFEIDSWRVNNSKELQKKVKSKLDEIYKEKMSKINGIKSKLDMLNEWDGYTTIQDRRDDKIKKVIG